MDTPNARALVEAARRDGIEGFAAGAIVHRNAGSEILLLRRRSDDTSFPGAEGLPSGGVGPEEDLLDGLARELREEIGLPTGSPLRLEPFVAWFDYVSRHGLRKRQFTFARPHDGSPVLLCDEHTGFRWFPAGAYADSDLTPQVKDAVGRWLDRRSPARPEDP